MRWDGRSRPGWSPFRRAARRRRPRRAELRGQKSRPLSSSFGPWLMPSIGCVADTHCPRRTLPPVYRPVNAASGEKHLAGLGGLCYVSCARSLDARVACPGEAKESPAVSIKGFREARMFLDQLMGVFSNDVA